MNDLLLNEISIDGFLREYFGYYNTLNDEWKKVFVGRVLQFVNSKSFIGKEGFAPDNKVRVIISASAVQLTLGLEVWDLNYFNTILLFPNDFFNKQTRQNLKGETNLAGFMSLSWKSFIDGYKISNDNLNLGLHEFTHALRFNGVKGENTDYFFTEYFPKWFCFARSEFRKLSNNVPSIFRKYGGSNINEFLSVSIEHFFESPEQFQKELPLLYSATAIMLNQKTISNKTTINIRDDEFKDQAQPVLFSEIPLSVNFFKTTPASVGIILFVLTAFTVYSTGLFSFPSLFLMGTLFFNFVLGDYKYVTASVYSNQIEFKNGFLLFKFRKSRSVSPSRLISAEFSSDKTGNDTVAFTFWEDHYFYEETVNFDISALDKETFISQLKKNYVWVKIQAD